jgi:AraC family transcriptional regulator
MYLPPAHFKNRRLETLVENRTVYSLEQAELNIYETQLVAEKVELTFNSPVLASMLQGKKVMHLKDKVFDFHPGESVILPPGELMCIDFPEATRQNPTHCLALTLDPQRIQDVMTLLNEQRPKLEEHGEWRFTDFNFHFTNDTAINQIISRLVWLLAENHPSKAVFAEFMIKELVIRLAQTDARTVIFDNARQLQSQSRLAYVVQYIRDHLEKPLQIEDLCRKACMSQAHFFRCFKNEFGVSPLDFIQAERIKLARRLLGDHRRSISDVCYACGFNSLSYFNKIFKRFVGLTPSAFRQRGGAEVIL